MLELEYDAQNFYIHLGICRYALLLLSVTSHLLIAPIIAPNRVVRDHTYIKELTTNHVNQSHLGNFIVVGSNGVVNLANCRLNGTSY